MFTGIIEETGIVGEVKKDKSNLFISVESSFTKEIKIDQSIAHNGVCLTVIEKKKGYYKVTAIEETLSKTNLKFLKPGDKINLERCMKADGRFDGHIVQGHVDCTAKTKSITEKNGSWIFTFQMDAHSQNQENLIVPKGSICINGVSLTLVEAKNKSFSVAIIPYTFYHTNFHCLRMEDPVNIEFDIIGKYIAKILVQRSL